ncbi:MAG TPA: IS200/IS605 family transposase [Candidatus Nanoarchaeia archaeon]|nr:IS200/IS605 family transposase [Candidatus Nanoarchaeia archaeon]
MKTELIVSSHAVGESNYHIQLTPAYRQDIFSDKFVAELTIAYIAEKLIEHKVILAGYGFGPDHLHLFVSNVRFVGEIKMVQLIKGFSSYMMRRGHWYMFRHKLWGDKFWSEGHFYRSVGAVTKESMEWYVTEGQKKHWIKHTYEEFNLMKNQKQLMEYN